MNRVEQIKQKVKDRGIRWLVHFTHIKNVDSILKHGIMTPSETQQLGANLGEQFIFPDQFRADGKNASCLSIMFPNHKMLWHKRLEYGDEAWVFLLLKPDVLWECDCAFYPTNAASTGLIQRSVENFKTVEAFEAMFASKVQKETTYEIKTIERPKNLKPFLPTDVQAEVLVFDTISPDYIRKCCFHLNCKDKAFYFISNYPNKNFYLLNSKHKLYDYRENMNWK